MPDKNPAPQSRAHIIKIDKCFFVVDGGTGEKLSPCLNSYLAATQHRANNPRPNSAGIGARPIGNPTGPGVDSSSSSEAVGTASPA
jgi:hypothetical protein